MCRFGIGKGVALRKLKSAPIFKQMAEVFCGKESCGDLVYAAEMTLSNLYGAQTGEGLDALCHGRFYEKVSKTKTAKQLCNYTVCLRPRQPRLTTTLVRICKCSGGWAKETIWTQENGASYECRIARMTDLTPATEAMLKVVRCSCRNVVTHECALVRKTDGNAQLSVVNARVSAA